MKNASSPTDRLPGRTVAGILIFVAGCLLSSARLIHEAPSGQSRADDLVVRSEQRFAAAKAQLPGRGVIGYLGESGNEGTENYYLAQYALAPLVVDRSANHRFVIGNFEGAPHEIPENLQLIRDFGNGVLLFANKDAK